MIKLIGKIPKGKFYVACSGGVDSMTAYHFLKAGKHDVHPLFIHHGTETSNRAYAFLSYFFKDEFSHFYISLSIPKGVSKEEYWRNERYKLFKSIDAPIVTGHQLSDCIETWISSSLQGQSKLIPYRHANVIRPFLATPKEELIKWAKKHNVRWIEDQTNNDIVFQRNYIRHSMMPHILKVNPGISKTIMKKVLTRGDRDVILTL